MSVVRMAEFPVDHENVIDAELLATMPTSEVGS
jgi:hypothetical protein